jgi:hypothetical protein
LTSTQTNLLQTISKHKAIGSREAASIVRDAVPGSLVKQKDIDNARQRLRLTALNGRTAVQQFISILIDMGYKHRIQWAEEDPTRPVAFVWTYPWCESMWKRFPEVIGLDNTYKTNRFKMPLFQVTGTTDIGSLYNCAFGLVSTERCDGYDFLLESIESIRAEIYAERPKVAITDFEDALRSSIMDICLTLNFNSASSTSTRTSASMSNGSGKGLAALLKTSLMLTATRRLPRTRRSRTSTIEPAPMRCSTAASSPQRFLIPQLASVSYGLTLSTPTQRRTLMPRGQPAAGIL